VTIAKRPSEGRDGLSYGFDLGQAETKIFLQAGLDWWNHVDPAREFFLWRYPTGHHEN
jgi:hypothetical protein